MLNHRLYLPHTPREAKGTSEISLYVVNTCLSFFLDKDLQLLYSLSELTRPKIGRSLVALLQ